MLDFFQIQLLRLKTLQAYRSGDWRKIPIQENHEPLVQVPDEIAFPFYARTLKLVSDERMFLRKEVLVKICIARDYLMIYGFDLKVYDGWRSLQLQENLFWHYMREFTAPKFDRREEFAKLVNFSDIRDYFYKLPENIRLAMYEVNRTFVSWPSKDPISPSPHSTGGAVDVWLTKKGVDVNLGVPFDWMEENAGTFYHLKLFRSKFAGGDVDVCHNRSRLILAMAKAGFSCYGPEFWHYNYGNQMDALVKGGTACYSYVEP